MIGLASRELIRTLSPVPQPPDTIADLEVWLDAGSLALSDNDPVSTWADRSGNGNDATQGTGANQPTYKTNILNGRPIVRFDATNDGMSTALTLVNPFSLICVTKWDGSAGTRRVIAGSNNWLMGPYSSNWNWFSGAAFAKTFPANSTDFVIHGVRQNASDGVHFLVTVGADDILTATAVATPGTPGSVRFGTSGAGGEVAGADVAQVVAYSREISDGELGSLIAYFNSLYG